MAPVFIYSGYRTGSTWLWSRFRQDTNACAYYEPFNEMLGSLEADAIFSIKPDTWRSHHPDTSAYMAEYAPLLGQKPGVPLFPKGDQNGARFIGAGGIDGPLDPDIEAYCANLIARAQERGRAPVLACTRMLGRVAGFRSAFGGQHILLLRNLFQQWNSYSGQFRFGNDYFLRTLHSSYQLAETDAYIGHISSHFSAEEIRDCSAWLRHANHDRIFCYFVAFHLYLLMSARRSADMLIDVNRLARSGTAYQVQITEDVAARTGLTIDLSDVRESVDFPSQPLTSVDDCRMLLRGMVDRLIIDHARGPEDARFVQGLLTDLWEEHARFQSATAGASEVIADLEVRQAELIKISEEAERGAAACLEDQRQSLQAELDLVRAAAAEANAQLEIAISESEQRDRQIVEADRHHAAMLREAEMRVAAGEKTLAEISGQLSALQQDHYALSRENGRLEEKNNSLEAELGRLKAAAAEANSKLEDAIKEKKQRERQSDDALRQYTEMLRNADEKISASEQALAQVNARLAEADARQAELATSLENVRQTARQHIQSLHDEITRTSDLLASRDYQLQRAATLLNELPNPFAHRQGLRLSLIKFFAGTSQLSAINAHRDTVEEWLGELVVTKSADGRSGETSRSEVDPWPAGGKLNIGGTERMGDNKPVTSVPRLLAPHDREFIHTAYQAVLGRAPDPKGEAYYLERLRSGAHKLDILKQLRRSPEGKAFIPGVAGLDKAIRRHHLSNLPLLGPIIRLFSGSEGNGVTQRQLRVILNDLGRSQHAIQRDIALLSDLIVRQSLEVPASRPQQAPAAEQVRTGDFVELPVKTDSVIPLTRRAQSIYVKLIGAKAI